MKRKSLIKYLSLMGLTLVTSCEKQEKSILEESVHYPPPFKSPVTQSVGFTPIAELNVPDSVNNQIIALSMLATDIFENPSIAISFSNDPQGYFKAKGLSSCSIDINSVEVKAVLAFADQDIKNAILANDLPKFVEVLQTKNYLSFDNAYFNGILKNYLESKDIQELLAEIPTMKAKESCIVPLVVAVAFHFYYAVTNYFYLYSKVEVNTSAYSVFDSKGYNFKNPVLKIWSLETKDTDIFVINELIEKYVDEIANVIENMNIYKQSENKLSHTDLKNWIRKPVTQRFIDEGLL
ncbi:MAG: hypothetical protein LBI45_07095 [Bacteroidales bacterium]|jgi:hypothetical protein|nr:hypothetical protein [Bacteroidales bacterium]